MKVWVEEEVGDSVRKKRQKPREARRRPQKPRFLRKDSTKPCRIGRDGIVQENGSKARDVTNAEDYLAPCSVTLTQAGNERLKQIDV